MAHSTITVQLSGALRDVVAANVGEYLRDLIRRDQERTDQLAFAAPESSYVSLSSSDVIQRNRVTQAK